jgi:hypothetical protein
MEWVALIWLALILSPFIAAAIHESKRSPRRKR